MTDEATHAAPPAAEPAAPALKSTDTRKTVFKSAPAEPKESARPAETKPEAVTASADKASPEGESKTDAPSAEPDHKRKGDRLPRWVKERMERERERVRRQTAAETREAVMRELQQPAPQRAAEQAQPRPDEGKKTLADFDFDPAAYTEYLVEHKIEAKHRAETQRATEAKQAEAAEQFKAKIDAFEERAGDGAYEDIESSRLNTDQALMPLVEMVMGEENSLDILHHLSQHDAEIDRIMALSPMRRAIELGKLADKLSGTVEPPKVADPPKKTTNAPPPPRSVAGAGKPSVDINSPSMSTADRIAAWRAKARG